ncbi:MAG: oligosaccharide flippase family protein [Ignavibacteria bacterium]|nr:oligosaccharide flippase family protein [Ignavibacteria bacterium]
MKLSENIDKVVWTLLDKGLYIIYGFVTLLQIRRLEPAEFGIYAILITIHTWLFILSDSLFYQGIIQFGFNPQTEKRANLFALLLSSAFIFIVSFSLYLCSDYLVVIFKEPAFKKITYILPFLSFLSIPRIYFLKFAFKHSNTFELFVVNSSFFLTMSLLTIYFFFTKPLFTFELMVTIYLSGTILSSATAFLLLRKKVTLSSKGTLTLREYFSFGLPIVFYSFFQSIPRQLDVLILQYFFQSKIVGIYYSAKTLFRLFEEGLNAAYSLVYPTAVRLIAKGKSQDLKSLMDKSTSFTFILVLFLFVILQFGGSELFIRFFLPEKYLLSISIFNFMLIAALFMPFQLNASLMIAEQKTKTVAMYIFFSAFASFASFLIVGIYKLENLLPLGIVIYYFLFGLLVYFYSCKNYSFSILSLRQGLFDIWYYLRNIAHK